MNLATDEYLVKLGFIRDLAGYHRFEGQIREAGSLVDHTTLSMAKSMLGWQTAITAGFAAVGLSALGLADKVSQADLGYQLFAMRMYMSTNQARSLKIAMDSLGASLEDIAWNPELRERAGILFGDEARMGAELGPNFEEQMRRIRDIRFEFTRMQVEMEFLGMKVVEDFFAALGTGPDQVLDKLRRLNDWIIRNIPQLSQQFTRWFMPIWTDTRAVLGDTLDLLKSVGVAFSDVIGLLSGDTALEGTTFSFEKMATAVQTVIHWMRDFVDTIVHAEELLLHLLNASSLGLSGNFAEAKDELKQAAPLASAGTGAILGAAGVAPAGAVVGAIMGIPAGPLGIMAGAGLGGMLGTGAGAALGAGFGAGVGGAYHGTAGEGLSVPAIQQAIISAAQSMGVDPNLALAVAKIESGFRQYDERGDVLMSSTPGSHATGIFQLQPGTARALGVDPANPIGNIQGGVGYLRQLLRQYGNDPETALEHYYGSANPAANADYAHKVMTVQAGITINSLSVHVPSGNPDEVRRSVVRGIEEAQGKQTQRNLAEFQSLGWSY